MYFERVAKFLKFGFWLINPHIVTEGERKLSKRIISGMFLQVVAYASSIAYTVKRFSDEDEPNLPEKAELIALFLIFLRLMCYFVILLAFGTTIESLIQRIIDERKSQLFQLSSEPWQLTQKYCKAEAIGSLSFFAYYGSFTVFMLVSPMFLQLNQVSQPLNFYILLLPYEGHSFNWLVNYIFQVFDVVVSFFFFFPFLSILLHIMDHSCWAFDTLMILVEECRSSSQNHDRNEVSHKEILAMKLNKIVQTSYSVLQWQNDVEDLLKFVFLIDFTLQSFMSGLCLVTLAVDVKASSFIFVMLAITMSQLLINCLMGERVVKRINKLTAAVYDLPWYLMTVKQQKDVQLILIMSQNMRGFNGIFNEVNMETFQAILDFTYSFYTLLLSTK